MLIIKKMFRVAWLWVDTKQEQNETAKSRCQLCVNDNALQHKAISCSGSDSTKAKIKFTVMAGLLTRSPTLILSPPSHRLSLIATVASWRRGRAPHGTLEAHSSGSCSGFSPDSLFSRPTLRTNAGGHHWVLTKYSHKITTLRPIAQVSA